MAAAISQPRTSREIAESAKSCGALWVCDVSYVGQRYRYVRRQRSGFGKLYAIRSCRYLSYVQYACLAHLSAALRIRNDFHEKSHESKTCGSITDLRPTILRGIWLWRQHQMIFVAGGKPEVREASKAHANCMRTAFVWVTRQRFRCGDLARKVELVKDSLAILQ